MSLRWLAVILDSYVQHGVVNECVVSLRQCAMLHIWIRHVDDWKLSEWHDAFVDCALLHIWIRYGVATISRIDKIVGLFCKRALQKRRYSAEETYDLSILLTVATPYDCQSSERHDAFICAVWRIHLRDTTHSLTAHCCTYEADIDYAMLHIWIHHVTCRTHEQLECHTDDEPCHTDEWGVPHI